MESEANKKVDELAGNIGGQLAPGAELRKKWKEIIRLARIGAALEALPKNHAIVKNSCGPHHAGEYWTHEDESGYVMSSAGTLEELTW